MTTDNLIQLNTNGHVYELIISRPEYKNALCESMYAALADLLKQAESDNNCRAVLLYGAGGNFTSGNDLNDFMHNPPTNDPECPVIDFMHTLFHFSKPVIAAIEGVAIGIGTTMLTHCDLVYTSDTAIFQMPFVNLGLTPEYGSSFLLPQACGQLAAKEYLLLGNSFSATDAYQLGLVNKVIDNDVVGFARKQALALAKKSPRAIMQSKQLMNGPRQMEEWNLIEAELNIFFNRMDSPDFREAIMAIKEKREPNFS